jgi:hypothetical protein
MWQDQIVKETREKFPFGGLGSRRIKGAWSQVLTRPQEKRSRAMEKGYVIRFRLSAISATVPRYFRRPDGEARFG